MDVLGAAIHGLFALFMSSASGYLTPLDTLFALMGGVLTFALIGLSGREYLQTLC